MAKIVVLGAGMVGREVARDLAQQHEVTALDRDEASIESLNREGKVRAHFADLSSAKKIQESVASYDIVVGALPGFMGFECLKAVIEARKNVVDIAFFSEDPFLLDDVAKKNGVTVVVDCGVGPGMSSVLAGYHNKRMKMTHYDCMVGGLPTARKWPFEYKAPFSPADVIEEYVRPARYLENGHEITRPALTDPELVYFDEIGTLESFNTDGLRTLARTINAPNMKEKTLRYPGHIRLMQELREIGFFETKKIKIGSAEISPLEFSSKIIFPHWKLGENEDEFTVMRVQMTGEETNGKTCQITYDLLDRFDRKNQVSSMARTTGYTCSAAVNLIVNGYRRQGICPPEFLGENESDFQYILNYLKERNVHYHKKIEFI